MSSGDLILTSRQNLLNELPALKVLVYLTQPSWSSYDQRTEKRRSDREFVQEQQRLIVEAIFTQMQNLVAIAIGSEPISRQHAEEGALERRYYIRGQVSDAIWGETVVAVEVSKTDLHELVPARTDIMDIRPESRGFQRFGYQ